ncbi:MAG TPA: methyltransferase domain-containing protein [Solirubrobacteraceae bacterium]|jgi:ubiquinone/menaquinone biosynthesis C-methylase UbiE|nr:methyltransferase domain-containing protein [Solirubrobacteraceae bacterium]
MSRSQPFMPPAERALRARSFGSVAAEYARGRPGYPAELVEWALGPEPLDVLDVGAGTGKLTEAVAARHRVVAIEPLAQMRALLEERLPDVRVVEGSAEELPVAGESVDAVVVGAAFHWFDHEQALAEIARVLRGPSVLVLVGNSFDTSVEWQAELREILGSATLGRPGHWPEPERLARTFAEVDDRDFPHVQQITLAQLRDYASSRSSFAVLPEQVRAERLAEIDALWRRTPALSEAGAAEIRWVARARRCRRLR